MNDSRFQHAYDVERRSIIRGDPRWLQIVYRNSQAFLDMIKACPRLVKAILPFAMMTSLGSLAVNISDIGKRIVDFIKAPTIWGFFGPIFSLLFWLVVLEGGFLFFWGLSLAIWTRYRPIAEVDKQLADRNSQATENENLMTLAEDIGHDTEPTLATASDDDSIPRRHGNTFGQGPKVWIIGCVIVSQVGMVLGVFLPVLLLMDLSRWNDKPESDFGVVDSVFLLSSLLALVLATEVLAWGLFSVLITFGDMVLDTGPPDVDL